MSAWIDQIFASDQANNGGVVRRSVDDVRTYGSEDELIAEVRRRRFHMVRIGDQYVILCNQGVMEVVV
jgi:hypothetical protein